MPLVVIEFGPSNSPRITRAVSIASTFKGHSAIGDRHAVEVEAAVDNWPRLRDLWSVVEGWKSTVCAIDGRPWTWHRWNALDGLYGCHERRAASPDGDLYCVGQESPSHEPAYPGCRFAKGARIVEPAGDDPIPAWWNFGTLSPDAQTFLVDREEIARRVELQSVDAKNCPAWSMNRVRAALKLLPSVLVVGDGWKLRYSSLDRTRPIGVEPHVAPLKPQSDPKDAADWWKEKP